MKFEINIKTNIVPPEYDGKRIDYFLARMYPSNPRSFYQRLLKEGYAKLNENRVGADRKIKSGDTVTIDLPRRKVLPGGCGKLDIIHEDRHIVVINKPAGVTVHPTVWRGTGGCYGDSGGAPTILDIIIDRYGSYKSAPGTMPFIVHRLDRDTSGVMVLAKTSGAQAWLRRQFAGHKVRKTYLCVVDGSFSEKKGSIDAQITRNYTDRKGFHVGAGKEAVTNFSVRSPLKDSHTLLEVMPVTGRTHQIRVHLAAIGHHVLGDKTYRPAVTAAPAYDFVKRQLLHSMKISFIHPASRKQVAFSAGLPADFRLALKKLKLTGGGR
jgi:23S rRNA pseudouridine1911/1915/1917 synthase